MLDFKFDRRKIESQHLIVFSFVSASDCYDLL